MRTILVSIDVFHAIWTRVSLERTAKTAHGPARPHYNQATADTAYRRNHAVKLPELQFQHSI